MSIVITGATGQLGRLVVEQLMAAGTPPDARKRLEAMLIPSPVRYVVATVLAA